MSSRVDRDALRQAIAGDPSRKVAVRKEWLGAVLAELEEFDRLLATRGAGDRLSKIFEHLHGGSRS